MNVYLPYTAILPSEYQEVEYIESSGTQYINTGWKSTIYDTIETKFSTKSSTTDTNLYGGRGPNDSYGATIQDLTVWINTSSGKGIAVHYPTNGNYGGLVDTGWIYTNNIIDTPTTLKVTPQYVYVNDVIRYTFNVTRTPYTALYNAFIFGRGQNGSPERLGKFRVYYLKIISNGTLVRDFVPCYRKSDSVIGMYDLVNNQFYTNAGTGTFSKGNDVTMVELKNAYIGEVWTPGSNTIAYYPLTSTTTVNDISGNNRNLTNNGVTFGTYGGVSCASFPNANAKRLSGTLPLTGNQAFTVNVYLWRVGNSIYYSTVSSQIFVLGNTGSSGGCFGTSINNSTAPTPNVYINYTWGNDKLSSYTNTMGQRELITVVNDTSTIKMYRNGTLINNNSISFSVNSTNFTIGSFPSPTSSNYQNFYGYMSEFIVENKVRTAEEILNYYNNTKSNYGL